MGVELKDAGGRLQVGLNPMGRRAEQHERVGEADDKLAGLSV